MFFQHTETLNNTIILAIISDCKENKRHCNYVFITYTLHIQNASQKLDLKSDFN